MEQLIEIITQNVNIFYVFMCNLITYIVIDCIENGGDVKRNLKKNYKRLTSAISAIIIGYAMIKFESDVNPDIFTQVFYGFFIQFLTWDYCFKDVIKFFKKKSNSSDEDVQ